MESLQVGKKQKLADLIANVEAAQTPFTSMAAKRTRPGNVDVEWQVKQYRRRGYRGVRDGQDAQDFHYNGREKLYSISQKAWELRGVSDFSEESDVAGVKSEIQAQGADALITVKQTVERRCLSNEDCRRQDEANADGANETRGIFCWLSPNEQKLKPVPPKYRPNAGQRYSGTLAEMNEDVLKDLARAAWKRRMGNGVKMTGFVGIDLKGLISSFTRYDDQAPSKVAVRTFNQAIEKKTLINIIDRLVFDTGEIDLIASAHLLTNPDTGEDTAFTHRSGVFVDMSKVGLAWTRLPRFVKLEYKGGGHRLIVDAIFCLMMDNPSGCFSALIERDSVA
jgi:hypothetical protein